MRATATDLLSTGPPALEVRGPGEWIFDDPSWGPAVHVYRLGGSDWLVSEVGRASEGRGSTLVAALGVLRGAQPLPAPWLDLVDALEASA